MKKPLAILLLLSSLIFGQNTGDLITVDRIIDGDTFESKDNIVYRMIGIDTPERGEDGYKEAGAHLALTIRKNCRDEFGEYNKGDMQINDQKIKHHPVASNSDGCICLSITENDVIFFGKFGPLLNLFTFIKSFFK